MTQENTASPYRPSRKIVLVIFHEAKSLDVIGPMQVFNDAVLEDGRKAYEVKLASAEGGPVTTDTGVTLQSEPIDAAMEAGPDTVLVVGGDPATSPAHTALLRARLAPHVGRPRRFGSICLGAFVLAELGVLDGLEVTTHWAHSRRLAQMYPAVTVTPDAIFVEAGRIWTSAGVSAGIDLALALVERDLGHPAALGLARDLVLFLKRPGGQSQFSVELRRQTQDARGRFDGLHAWMRANLQSDLSVPELAAVAHMSPRNFARVYTRETGESPARAVEQMRVEEACRLLESTHDTIQTIAYRVGFGDDERLRRAFVKNYRVSPHDYRIRFASNFN
ncbi:GlxA family transcriptional regulator [Methylobacterium oryzae CBMB20]